MMVRMRFWQVTAATVLSLTVSTVHAAPNPSLDDLLKQAQTYVAQWVPQLANLVAVEEYEQKMTLQAQPPRTLRLKSDVLLVGYPGSASVWMFFRDVAVADNQTIGTNQDRILYLFANQTADAAERAGRISNESLRYSLPGASVSVTNPLLTAALVQAYYQPRLRFSLGDTDRSVGPSARILRFEEIEEIKRTTDAKDTQEKAGAKNAPRETLPALLGEAGRVKGSVWIDTESGRILKTEARIGDLAGRASTTTTFAMDEKLGVMVPKEMRTSWRHDNTPVNGTARYSNYRRFQVTADTPIIQQPQ
jgi:hypothetical protein